MKKIILSSFLLILILGGIAFSQEDTKKKKFVLPLPKQIAPEVEIPVMTFRVKKIKSFKENIPILGTIVPFEEIELNFPERGLVKTVYVDVGDTVEKGQVLAELEDKDFILRCDYAENKYRSEHNLFLSMEKSYQIKERLYLMGCSNNSKDTG